MTSAPDASIVPKPRASWREGWAVYLQRRVLIVLLLGFSSGLPLALSGSTLRFWMRESGIDLETIGLFALVGLPYTIKFIWAPLVDALDVPLLSAWLGRRRGWLILSQLALIAAIMLLGLCSPAFTPWYIVFGVALLVATASATQDIVVDAFRIESLDESEQAAGMASYVAAYRISNLVSTAGALYIVSGLEEFGLARGPAWTGAYIAMAALIVIGMIAVLLARAPTERAEAEDATVASNPATRVFRTAYGAFSDLLSRDMAIASLAFVVLYKFTDAFSGVMTEAFVLDLGFERTDYAKIVKGVGLAATLLGGFAGGFLARAYSLPVSLWIGGVLQATANLSFTWLAFVGMNHWALALAITVENFTSAIGTVIFVAYLSSLCKNPLHVATQYALLTAFASLGRTVFSAGAGYVAKATGWPLFFAICVVVAVPSLILLAWLQRRGHFEGLGTVRV
ncbi:MFS transporter [uncultured Bradyrhizobium sp.]|uniref:AmpG family muropeptide MFS transporter n=1 Tax=uncultured Bradyrhizobium sp. TaxID=199684 RepID=UPI0035CB3A9A